MHRTTFRLLPAAFAAFMLASAAHAQKTPRSARAARPRTASACLDTIVTAEREAVANRMQTGLTYRQIAAAKRTGAHDCILALSKKARPVSDIPALARLQLIAADTSAAIATVQQYLTLSAPNDSVRAERYVAAIPLLISSRAESSFLRANELTQQLDSLQDVSAITKVVGHGGMLAYYRAIDNDDQIATHAEQIIALAPSLDSASRQRAARTLILAYTSMAEVYGDRAEEKNAVSLLTKGLTDLTDIPAATAQLSAVRDRYALVGTKGAPLLARYWLNAGNAPQGSVHWNTTKTVAPTPDTMHANAGDSVTNDSTAHDSLVGQVAYHDSVPDSTGAYSPTGHVTLVQFTAHWCGPCRKSYSAITRLQAKYAERDYHTVFVTNLYGFMGDRENLAPAEEVAADSEYFVNTHDLPFPIGIAIAADSQPGHVDANSLQYKVGGIPHIVLLDRQGTIRMIVIGWDPASEARLDAMIANLLDEKIVSR